MLKHLLVIAYCIIGASIGIFLVPIVFEYIGNVPGWLNNVFVYAICGALMFALLFSWTIPKLVRLIHRSEDSIMQRSLWDIMFATIGMGIGLVIAALISFLIDMMDFPLASDIIPLILAIILGYLGFKVGLKKFHEILDLFPNLNRFQNEQPTTYAHPKLVDTSAIIDGRIIDVVKTGFLEGDIIIPQFVLDELQLVADATDSVKRDKGQRGLDLLNELQSLGDNIHIQEVEYDKLDVDHQLIELAKPINASIITTDYNLNKVCQVHQVKVLNVNELSDAIKLNIMQGDQFNLFVAKVGKEENQGVGYLEDGTMVVVENGKSLVNQTVKVIVTSVLQTNSGRIIFCKKAG